MEIWQLFRRIKTAKKNTYLRLRGLFQKIGEDPTGLDVRIEERELVWEWMERSPGPGPFPGNLLIF